ncbi:MAG: ribonuclease D [Porticoccus sp.]
MPNDSVISLPVTSPPVLVTNTAQLQDCIEQLSQCDAVAIDTEFMRTDTFYPILGLVQLFDGETCWLIDPLEVSDLDALSAMLVNPDITKVFHSSSEDLEVLQHVLGCVPQPLFDTQVAAAMTGYGFSKGYAALVDAMLGIHVPKGETRSDWLKRPLRDAQLGYAASDVYHLLPVYRQLCESLNQLGRHTWVDEEMASLIAKSADRDDIDHYYLKVKGAWQLTPQRLEALNLLCQWRETEARARNRPRNRLVADKTLLEMAIVNPQGKHALAEIEGMHPGIMRRYADILLELLARGLSTDKADCPKPLPEPLPRKAGDMIKQLKKSVVKQAEMLDLPPEVLARKRDLEALVRNMLEKPHVELPASIANGWRYEAIGKILLDAAKASK